MKLKYCYTDYWSRPVYVDENGKRYKDVACGRKRLMRGIALQIMDN